MNPTLAARQSASSASESSGDIDSVDFQRTAVGLVDTRNKVEQRAFAGAGRAHQRDEIARHDVERDIGQDRHHLSAAAVGFGELPDLDNRFGSVFLANCALFDRGLDIVAIIEIASGSQDDLVAGFGPVGPPPYRRFFLRFQ